MLLQGISLHRIFKTLLSSRRVRTLNSKGYFIFSKNTEIYPYYVTFYLILALKMQKFALISYVIEHKPQKEKRWRNSLNKEKSK